MVKLTSKLAASSLAAHFREKRAEAIDMFLTEYNPERQRALERRDALEEGIELAFAEKVKKGLLTEEQAAAEKAELEKVAVTA